MILELSDRCDQATMRVDRIIHLDTMTVDMDRDLAEYLLEYCGEWFKEPSGVEGNPVEWFREEIGWIVSDMGGGWIVSASTPVKTRINERSCTFSWGHYITKPFYGKTYEEALEQAFVWANNEWEDA